MHAVKVDMKALSTAGPPARSTWDALSRDAAATPAAPPARSTRLRQARFVVVVPSSSTTMLSTRQVKMQ